MSIAWYSARRQAVQKQRRGALEVARAHEVDAFVHLEPILAVPVTALLQLKARLVDALGRQVVIVKEEAHANQREANVEPLAQRHSLVSRHAKGRQRRLLVADATQIRGLGQQRLTHLNLALVGLGIGNARRELLHPLLVYRLQARRQRRVLVPALLLGSSHVERAQLLLFTPRHKLCASRRPLALVLHIGAQLAPKLEPQQRQVRVKRQGRLWNREKKGWRQNPRKHACGHPPPFPSLPQAKLLSAAQKNGEFLLARQRKSDQGRRSRLL